MARTSAPNKVAAVASRDQIAAQTLVIDNGAHTIKAGFSNPSHEPDVTKDCHIIPNCIARSARDKKTYIGTELYDCADYGELAFRRPVEKGFVVNWEGEKAIWTRAFLEDDSVLQVRITKLTRWMVRKLRLTDRDQCDPHETNLILTEGSNAPTTLQKNCDEMVFEEFEFTSYYRTTAHAPSPFLDPSHRKHTPEGPMQAVLVVDIGHSYSTVTPLLQGHPLHSACRRLEVGGKTLTNHLKELVSRTFDIHKEDWIAMEIKEDVCYVSQTFDEDLEKVWKGGIYDRRAIDPSVAVDYILPDYETIRRGYFRPYDSTINLRNRALGVDGEPKEHIVTIGNERFVVPELIFSPMDIGMQQDGICGTIKQSLAVIPSGLWQLFLANIIVTGGSSKFPGFVERLQSDLQRTIDEKYLIRVRQANDPIKHAWLGGARLAQHETDFKSLVVTRQDYLEHGDLWTRRKFAGKVSH